MYKRKTGTAISDVLC